MTTRDGRPWLAVTIRYRDLSGRRELICDVLPAAAAEAGIQRWFFADLRPGTGGTLEMCIEATRHDGAPLDRVTGLVDAHGPAGTQVAGSEPATAAVLSPVLFGGNTPPDTYVAVHCVASIRVVAWARRSRREADRREVEGELWEMVSALSGGCVDRVLHTYLGWLEEVQRGATATSSSERPDENPRSTPPTGLPVLHSYRAVASDFARTTEFWPRDQLVARLAHTQALRLDPALTLSAEIQLLRRWG